MAVVTIQQSVAALYVAVFNRAPDAAGLNAWTAVITSGQQTFAQVAAGFAAHEVFTTGIGTLSNTDFVAALYQNILGSAGDAGGIANWSNQLNAGMSKADVAALFVQAALTVDIPAMLAAGSLTAAEAAAATVRQQTLTNKADVGIYFANTLGAASNLNPNTVSSSKAGLEADPIYNASKAAIANVTDSPASVAAAKDAIAVAAGSSNPAQALLGGTFTLTADQDTLAGAAGNDTYTAGSVQTANAGLQDSLQSVDSINGGAGTDTLNVTLNQGVVAAPSLTSVENVNLRVTAAASSLSLAGATGVTNVTIENSTIASTAVTGTVSEVGAANLAVKNQKTAVSFDGSTATTLGLTLDTVGTGGAVAPAHIAVDLGLVAAAKATTLNITANNANADVNATQAGVVTTVNVAATGVNELKLNDAKTTATAITVTGAGSVDFVTNGVTLTAVKTLTVADGGVTIDATGGVLETATTGAGKDTLTVVGSKVKTISTGAGDDKVTAATDALGATAVVDLGAGNDTLSLAVAPTAGVTLKAGDGTDTLDVTAAAYATITGVGFTDAQRALISGFEVLSLSDATGASGTTDLSKLAGLTSFQAKGVAVANATVSGVGANAAIILKGDLATNKGALTVTLKDATGSSDALNLTLNANYAEGNNVGPATIAAITETVSAANVEVLNVTSTGTASTPFLGAVGTVADGVNNTLALTADALTTLNVTGDQAFTFSTADTQTKLATIDASANTGGAVISAAATITATNAALTIKGSATASNSLTGSANADTIVGGAKADVITGGKGGDTLTGKGGNDKFMFAAGDSSIGTGKFDTITDFVANTKGAGVNGAVTAVGATGVAAADLTGDVLSFAKLKTDGKIIIDVLNSAADATTFLANNTGSGSFVAALDKSSSNLYVDNTNDGVADFYIHLTGVTTIDAAAIVLA